MKSSCGWDSFKGPAPDFNNLSNFSIAEFNFEYDVTAWWGSVSQVHSYYLNAYVRDQAR